MDAKHQKIIQTNYIALSEQLDIDIRTICNRLMESGIISKHMRDSVMREEFRGEALLDLIIRRGPNAYNALYTNVLQSELYEAADILMPEKGPHYDMSTGPECAGSKSGSDKDGVNKSQADGPVPEPPSSSDPVEPDLPDRWPSEEHCPTPVTVQKVKNGSPMKEYHLYSMKPLGQTHWYTMRHKCRGRAVIINNETFSTIKDIKTKSPNLDLTKVKPLGPRKGTKKDEDSLTTLFTELGFVVKPYWDKTQEEIQGIIDQESSFDHTDFDCFVLIISSHGYDDSVFGADGYFEERGNKVEPKKAIKVREIKEKICGVRSLASKPKLFFIQACRGETKTEGITRPDGAESDGSPSASILATPEENLQNAKQMIKGLENQDVCDGPSEDRVHPHADYFLAVATTQGMVAWRNEKHGSWFIQAIVYIFSNYAHAYDIQRLMTLVNKLVSKAETHDRNRYLQVAEWSTTFSKTFAFFPGLHL